MEKKLAEYRAKKAKEQPSSSDGWFSLNPFRRRNEKSQPQVSRCCEATGVLRYMLLAYIHVYQYFKIDSSKL